MLPLLGAAALIVVKGTAAKQLALVVSFLTLAISLVIAFSYRPGAGMQFDRAGELDPPARRALRARPRRDRVDAGAAGRGVTPLVIIASWHDADPGTNLGFGTVRTSTPTAPAPKYDARVFFALVLAVESCALFLFLATDVFLFYVFFEVILIPMYFLIGGFGGPRRAYAASKFLIFGLLGGFVMLASVIGLYVLSARAGAASYLLADLTQLSIDTGTGRWLFVGFMFAFAIKAPLVPLHTWLPDAAEESSPGGATMMVGVMDKIGTFGMIRFCLELFPEASQWATPVVIVLAVISIIYGAILAIGSRDLMRLIAYTSISHFGFIVLGIFALTVAEPGRFHPLHAEPRPVHRGPVPGGGLPDQAARLARRGGFRRACRRWRRSRPGCCSSPGCRPCRCRACRASCRSSWCWPARSAGTRWRAAISTLAIVLAALYILIMYQRTMTGPVSPAVEATIRTDLDVREKIAIAPLVILILVLGLFPRPMLDVIDPAVQATMQRVGVSDPQPAVTVEGGR